MYPTLIIDKPIIMGKFIGIDGHENSQLQCVIHNSIFRPFSRGTINIHIV